MASETDVTGGKKSIRWGLIVPLGIVALLVGYGFLDEFRVQQNRDLMQRLRRRILDKELDKEGIEAERKALGAAIEWSTESLGTKAVFVAQTPATGLFAVREALSIECEGDNPCTTSEVSESGNAF